VFVFNASWQGTWSSSSWPDLLFHDCLLLCNRTLCDDTFPCSTSFDHIVYSRASNETSICTILKAGDKVLITCRLRSSVWKQVQQSKIYRTISKRDQTLQEGIIEHIKMECSAYRICVRNTIWKISTSASAIGWPYHCLIFGPPMGRTQFALAHFDRPLLVSKISDLKKYKYGYDGTSFIYNKVNFTARSNVHRHMVDWDLHAVNLRGEQWPFLNIHEDNRDENLKEYRHGNGGVVWRVNVVRIVNLMPCPPV
jgi:hypothetical protein